MPEYVVTYKVSCEIEADNKEEAEWKFWQQSVGYIESGCTKFLEIKEKETE